LFPEFAENGSVFDYIHVNHKQSSLAQRLLWLKQMAEGMVLGICQGKIYNFEHSGWSQFGLSFYAIHLKAQLDHQISLVDAKFSFQCCIHKCD